jgi:hypothetical protein
MKNAIHFGSELVVVPRTAPTTHAKRSHAGADDSTKFFTVRLDQFLHGIRVTPADAVDQVEFGGVGGHESESRKVRLGLVCDRSFVINPNDNSSLLFCKNISPVCT